MPTRTRNDHVGMRHPIDRSSALSLYIRDLSGTPLLNAEEELSVARRVVRGDRAAYDHLYRANLRLVVRIAIAFRKYGLDIDDLIGIGNVGLASAVRKFDPELGNRFSTYASWWIKQAMRRELTKLSTIYIPAHAHELMAKVHCHADPERCLSSLPETTQEIYRKAMRSIVQNQKMVRIDQRESEEDWTEPTGQESDPAEAVEERAAGEHRKAVIWAGVNSLKPRLRLIAIKRYGLDGTPTMTLNAISKEMGITRERIRQLQEEVERLLWLYFSRNGVKFEDVA